MPSPFPGMDPYLEAPHIWPDLHNSLAGHIRDELNAVLPPPYYAQLDMRPEIGIVEPGVGTRRIVPDVAVARPSSPPVAGGVAVLDAPRRTISASKTVRVQSEPLRHAYVEVRDPTQGHQLITLIEIVSPSNKRRGEDRTAYLQKQREILDSDASLIELDLLRTGERLLSNAFLEDAVFRLEPPPDYLVLVNRAWQRIGLDKAYLVFPILLTEPLPCVPVPLREGQDETPLDLQYALQRAYDGGPYRRGAVDYNKPPQPPLVGHWAEWAQERIRLWRGA
jgi:Protein of unknown function (DUF4058)